MSFFSCFSSKTKPYDGADANNNSNRAANLTAPVPMPRKDRKASDEDLESASKMSDFNGSVASNLHGIHKRTNDRRGAVGNDGKSSRLIFKARRPITKEKLW